MRFLRSNFSFLVAILFLASCSSMNVTEETVNANNVKTVKASQMMDENITYDSQAVFANATIYFDFDKTNLTSKSLQTLKSVAEALNENSQLRVTLAGHADERGTREYNLALGQVLSYTLLCLSRQHVQQVSLSAVNFHSKLLQHFLESEVILK